MAMIGFDKDFVDEIDDTLDIYGYFALEEKKSSFRYLGNHKNIPSIPNDIPLLITFDDVKMRKLLYDNYSNRMYTYISPNAIVSSSSIIGRGSMVMRNSHIGPNTIIGRANKINIGNQIHHDVTVGDYNVITPRCLMLGHVNIGNENYIGAGSMIRNTVTIGSSNIIGMGTNLITNILNNCMVAGNPGKIKKESLKDIKTF